MQMALSLMRPTAPWRPTHPALPSLNEYSHVTLITCTFQYQSMRNGALQTSIDKMQTNIFQVKYVVTIFVPIGSDRIGCFIKLNLSLLYYHYTYQE